MDYELVLNVGFWGSIAVLIIQGIWSLVKRRRDQKRAMAAVYARRSNVECAPRVVGYSVRISRIPLPPPEARGFFHPELGEPFEWVADKEEEKKVGPT